MVLLRRPARQMVASTVQDLKLQSCVRGTLTLLVQDYETAVSALQFSATDFKAERAWKHYAGAQVSSFQCWFSAATRSTRPSIGLEPQS